MTFEKNPSYFFEIIRKNNRIRNVINDCKTDNVDDIQDEKERDDVILYLKNRGCIFINKHSGYLKYKRGNIFSKKLKDFKEYNKEINTDNYESFENCYAKIKWILNAVKFSEMVYKKHFGINKIDEYYCKEHNIHNHKCIDINDYQYDTFKDKHYEIDYFSNITYNCSVTKYNKYYGFLNNDDEFV